jgi:hypothetical protein
LRGTSPRFGQPAYVPFGNLETHRGSFKSSDIGVSGVIRSDLLLIHSTCQSTLSAFLALSRRRPAGVHLTSSKRIALLETASILAGPPAPARHLPLDLSSGREEASHARILLLQLDPSPQSSLQGSLLSDLIPRSHRDVYCPRGPLLTYTSDTRRASNSCPAAPPRSSTPYRLEAAG